MTDCGQFNLEISQRNAWRDQIQILKESLNGVEGTIFFEFDVPRIGSRIDCVLLVGAVLFLLEFKVGESEYRKADYNQTWDYALDLKNFHKESHNCPIIPVLIATEASNSDDRLTYAHEDGVYPPIRSNRRGIRNLILKGNVVSDGPSIDPVCWSQSPYQPTPTIIEAAQRLFAHHSVDSIARHDAGAVNLTKTSKKVEQLIDLAEQRNEKAIIFVTGVPGAGKTLVGLNVATKKRNDVSTHAVFLSGNGPLVEVLSEALTRDEIQRLSADGIRSRKGLIKQKVKAFIQNVHHFRDEGIRIEGPPSDHVVIFDEAQRAWDQKKTSDFMARKKNQPGFSHSEPDFLISFMNRHEDWAVVICLVGGGQEIHQGEAGISAWLDAIRESFPDWKVYLSSSLTDSEYAAGQAIKHLRGVKQIHTDVDLHLAASMRSFRAENVSNFVKALLDCETQKASRILLSIESRYPIRITRNLTTAKNWITKKARGTERYGIVASSGAQRLKPHAIDIRVSINPVHWFLNSADDTRSSFYLEDAATEFQIQGLELDWICVSWDADLRFSVDGWDYNSFRGSKWTKIHKIDRRQYLINAYRVLLTRARQGMVIFLPEGEPNDPTRSAEFYDDTYRFLCGIGIKEI